MATLDTDDANVLDAEAVNWRLVVYPLLAALIVVVGGFTYYYYLQMQRADLEDTARAAMLKAATPEELVKVADQFPHTDQGTLALLAAADGSFAKRDYPTTIADYQRVIDNTGVDAVLRESAQLGLASALEASGKNDDAINAYLEVARRGDKSPYAPFGYNAAARLYDERGDKDNERKVLTEAASLDADSPFVKEAQFKLKQLNAASIPIVVPAPAATSPAPSVPATNAAPVKAKP